MCEVQANFYCIMLQSSFNAVNVDTHLSIALKLQVLLVYINFNHYLQVRIENRILQKNHLSFDCS